MGDSGAGVVDVKRLSLIDFSSEDDHLIDTSPARPVGPQFLGDRSLESLQGLDPENTDEQGNKMAPKNVEQLEEKASRTPENYHLRESLAWDSAFFTSDGVLEPEELTSMIKNSEKKEMRTLPIILEETQRSTESISTLASDTLTLTSLEGELFEDIRASIQKSSKITNIQMFGSKAGQSSFGAYVHHSSRKADADPASHGKLKPKPTSRKSCLGMIRPGKTKNQVPVHRQVSRVQSDAVGGDPNSNSLPSKPPKPGMVSPISSLTKRESMGVKHRKTEKNHTEGAAEAASESKMPVSSGTRRTLPGSSSSISSSARSTKVKTPQPNSSASDSSDKTGKSCTNLRNKGAHSRSKKLSSAGSFTLKTPPKSTPSRLSANMVSATKLSTSMSPASSFSECSSESSSSTSAVKQRSNDSRASLETSSYEKTCDDGGNRQQLDGPKTHGSADSTQRLNNASTGGSLLPNSMGPSGLRMPSPKIGFFDGMKSGRTPSANRQQLQVIPSVLPDVGSEISKPGSINKVKDVKSQSARTAIAVGRTKGHPKHSSSGGSRKSLPPKSSNTLEKVSSASKDAKHSSPSISPTGQSSLYSELGCGNQLKAEEGKAKETGVKTCDDKESPGDKPVFDARFSKNNAIGGGIDTSNMIMDLVDGSIIPVKRDDHVENGLVADQSCTGDASEHLFSRNLPICNRTESLKCSFKLSSPSTAKTDIATSARQPFTAINSFCNMDDSCDVLAGWDASELGKRIDLPYQGPLSKNS